MPRLDQDEDLQLAIALSKSLMVRLSSASNAPGARSSRSAFLWHPTLRSSSPPPHHHLGLLISAQVAHDDAEVSNPGADASKLTDAMLEEDEHDECRIAELLQARRSASLSPRLSAAAHCMRLRACARKPSSNHRSRHRIGMRLAGLPVGRTTRAGRARRELG